jgi:AraC-like DNA-binding protein
MRVTGTAPGDLLILQREGITPKDFANPDTRVRHRAMMELLAAAVERLGDPTLGLRAAESVEPGDFETLELAYRSCADMREAIKCAGRYMFLMHGAQETRLLEYDERAVWEVRITDDVEQLPAANDFALASTCGIARRYTGQHNVLHEVHFRHAEATSQSAYARVFEGAEIKLGMPHNALVFARSHLDAPMSLAHAGLKHAFELHANAAIERIRRSQSMGGRVRQLLLAHLAAGDVSMAGIARRMALSVATLRRRLADEGTSHSQLLDEVRRELAERYLADRNLAIGEVAFLLGFSHVTAFYKAFRRWSRGPTPAAFRAESLARPPLSPVEDPASALHGARLSAPSEHAKRV